MPQTRTPIYPWMLITLLCVIYVIVVILSAGGSPLSLVTIGTRFSQNIAAEQGGTEGYDGQFNYYIARDPSTAAQYLDVPAYRFQRILFPIMGRVLTLGQESLIPWTFLIINLIALAWGTFLLESLLKAYGVSRWYALSYGLTLGVFGSVRLSLSEPLAYGLVIGAIYLANREGWLLSAVLLALAALAKETTLFFAAGFVLYLLYKREWVKAVYVGLIAVIPFAIWQLVLRANFGSFGVGSGGALATSFEVIPFMGIVRIITDSAPEARAGLLLIFSVILIPFVLVPMAWALRRSWRDIRANKISFYTCLILVTAGVMPFVPFSTYREPIGILRFIVGLQIAVIVYAAQARNQRVLRNSTIWVLTTFFAVSLLGTP